MYQILLLQDGDPGNCRLKEYLQLSDYYVEEGNLNDMDDIMKSIYVKDLVLIYCSDAACCFAACERLRSLIDIPIIVLTENDDEWTKIKMFQLGADDYIVEPFHNGELVARLKARIDQYQRLTRSFGYIRVKDLTIAVLNRRVFLKSTEIPMTIREFDLLAYLAQRPDMVVTKEEIFHAMWQERYMDTSYNSVASYVKKIRQKIEQENGGHKYIETIWGVGYRFNT